MNFRLPCLALLPLLGVLAPSVPSSNLALNKNTELSSTDTIYVSENCANGNAGNWHSTCCKTTGTDPWNWFLVDLEESFTIKSIRITNRICCIDTISNFTIEVSSENPKTLDGFPGVVKHANVCLFKEDIPTHGFPTAYHCQQPATGRFVRVVMHNPGLNKWMSFCELEVYPYYERNFTVYPPANNNIALHKPTSQSAYHYSHRMVDGNLNIIGQYMYIAETAGGQIPHWLMVDLQNVYVIDTFRIINRGDCCQFRLRNFTIEVSMDDPTSYNEFPWRTTKASTCMTQIDQIDYVHPVILKCDRPVVGRWVRIVKEMTEMISLIELEAFELQEVKRFAYAGGSQAMAGCMDESSLEARRYVTSCTRQFMRSIAAMQYYDFYKPFIHVDLGDGKCRYLENFQDNKDIISSSWVVYTYE